MAKALKVLCVGSSQMHHRLLLALLPEDRYTLLVVSNYWDLCSFSVNETEAISVAVLEHTESKGDLRRSAEYVRRRWPDARIILLGHRGDLLEDQLYDERVTPGIHPPELLSVIEHLLKRRRDSNKMARRAARVSERAYP
ncbi:hypothetical protein [Occallatibacter riparius]|uniref:Uncharacterized protein n=1 Tax=Occallatibacter riparius TaxID=1002689 RepID=A0A9J7BPC6_9BACT|nr:hypothetical protein [Occallatibacter riparius]UWZ83602.1 hypothetical protein MOP44_23925 [Occallatibacter riparius]